MKNFIHSSKSNIYKKSVFDRKIDAQLDTNGMKKYILEHFWTTFSIYLVNLLAWWGWSRLQITAYFYLNRNTYERSTKYCLNVVVILGEMSSDTQNTSIEWMKIKKKRKMRTIAALEHRITDSADKIELITGPNIDSNITISNA